MTEEEKIKITNLRNEGVGYIRIAQMVGLSENTVKSYCRRHGLAGMVGSIKKELDDADGKHFCINCGVAVPQVKRCREKKFCCDKCRNAWWNANLDKVNRKANFECVCEYCHKAFISYAVEDRKYCSRSCYFKGRFGGGDNE